MKTPRPWTVLPHGPIVELGSNLRAVEGTLPSGHVPRRMLIARRSDGRLVFYNAIPLAEAEMRALEAFGSPAFLVVPNGFHRLDVHAFKARYPGLQVLCAAVSRKQVEKNVAVNGTTSDFPSDSVVSLITARGTKTDEPLLLVKSPEATALCFGDLIMNLVSVAGFDGFLLKLLGSVGDARVTAIAKLLVMKDRAAVKAHLEELATLPNLTFVAPSHGQIIDRDAPAVLRRIAAKL